ncbi:MAG: dihydrolipoamide acetyltransferase family protein [Dehalococcoidales bacterium]|nr:dihydrolipoamide acetyltransferase family protein [Dehalococcoidales bacterium]
MTSGNKEGEQSRENPVAEVIALSGWRKTLAERMLGSHLRYAEVTQMREVDVTELVNLRQSLVSSLEAKYGVRVSYTHLLIKAVAQSLRQFPIINSSLVEEEIRIFSNINIGMAVALDNGGLLTPVIRNVNQKSIVEVVEEAINLTRQIKTRHFNLDDLQGGTFTVTNAGMYGTDFVTPLINAPQSAALGVGRLVPKPVVRDNQIVIRTMMGLSLTYDHRIIAGATAAQFFQALENVIENPVKMDLRIS